MDKMVPTKAQLLSAFSNLKEQNKITDLQVSILTAQYWAPNHTISALALSKLVGCALIVVNGQYGKLGHLVASEIGFIPEQRQSGTYRWWKVLSAGHRNAENTFIWSMHTQVAEAIKELRLVHLDGRDDIDDEVVVDRLREGTIYQRMGRFYERNPIARKRCLSHWGTSCCVCGFNFAKMYGILGEGFIHVHHLRPISEIGETYNIDPTTDLRPVCPNCHAMLHKSNPPLTIEQLKNLIGIGELRSS